MSLTPSPPPHASIVLHLSGPASPLTRRVLYLHVFTSTDSPLRVRLSPRASPLIPLFAYAYRPAFLLDARSTPNHPRVHDPRPALHLPASHVRLLSPHRLSCSPLRVDFSPLLAWVRVFWRSTTSFPVLAYHLSSYRLPPIIRPLAADDLDPLP